MIKALKLADWKIAGEKGAASLLGIKPSTLTYRMQQFGIKK
jgi:transcriptional regulator with GAF, ATPase, and Fis domain